MIESVNVGDSCARVNIQTLPKNTFGDVWFLSPANEVWGKVMFLHLCDILFTGGDLHPGGSASSGVCIHRGVCFQGRSASEVGGGGGVGRAPHWILWPMGYSQRAYGTHPTGMHSC